MSSYFKKVGSGFYLKKDICDKEGHLLLAKGQKITSATKMKLEQRGNLSEGNSSIAEDSAKNIPIYSQKSDIMLKQTIQSFGLRKKLYNNDIIEKSYRIITSILFESKSEPWFILVNALINYSDFLYTHSIDVSMLSLILAAELKYSDSKQWNLGLGAFLHDIGKTLLPITITEKPNNLTDTEMFYIQQHCELGANSLKMFDFPKECTDIVLYHHEFLDGSGYPKGLKDNEISQDAQIVLIANVLDNLSTTQYKSAYTMGDAFKILKNSSQKYPQDLVSILEQALKS